METILNYLSSNWNLLLGSGVLGLCVGILTGLFGAGGGFIIVPALNIFLGIDMNIAVGTSACQVLGASGLALYHHLDRRVMGIRVALFMGIGIPLGSFLGVAAVQRFKETAPFSINGREINAVDLILLSIFAVFLSLTAAWLLFDNFYLRRGKKEEETSHAGFFAALKIPPMIKFRTIPVGEFSAPVLIIMGFSMGFLSGLLGIGGGVIMMPMLFYLVGQQTKYAASTSTMLIFITGFFSTISHAWERNIDYLLVLFLMCGAIFGTRTGAAIQRKISGTSLRKYFAFVVLVAVLMVFYKLYRMIYF